MLTLFCPAPVNAIRISTHPPQLNATDDNWSLKPSAAVFRLVEGRPATLRCTAVGGYPPLRLQLFVDDRVDVAWPAAAMSTASAASLRGGGGRGLRLVTVTSWRWTFSYRARPTDDGAQVKCLATVPGLAAVVDAARLNVDCEYDTHDTFYFYHTLLPYPRRRQS